MDPQPSVTPKTFEMIKSALKDARSLDIALVSNSMWPVLPTGSRAQIELVAYDDLKPLDFIVFYSDGALICHCVWDRGVFRSASGERTLVTRGLANPMFDMPVRESHLLGRVTSHKITRLKFTALSAGLWLMRKVGLRRLITGSRSRSSSSSTDPR